MGWKSFEMSRGGRGDPEEIKMLWGGGSDKYSTEDYLNLNVMGRGVIRNQMLGSGGDWKNLLAHPPLSFSMEPPLINQTV